MTVVHYIGIDAACTGYGSTSGHNVIKVCLQVFLGDIVGKGRHIIEGGFPIHTPQMLKVEHRLDSITDLKEGNVTETEGIVGDNALELHTEALGVLSSLDEEGHPVWGAVWILHHQFGYINGLWDDVLADKAIDTLIIGVLLCIAELTCIAKVLIVHVLRHEDTCRGNLCIPVMLQHHPDTLIAHQLHGSFRIIGKEHGLGCLPVNIDAVIASGLHGAADERNEEYDKDTVFHNGQILIIYGTDDRWKVQHTACSLDFLGKLDRLSDTASIPILAITTDGFLKVTVQLVMVEHQAFLLNLLGGVGHITLMGFLNADNHAVVTTLDENFLELTTAFLVLQSVDGEDLFLVNRCQC